MASRKIEDLDPRVHERAAAIVRAWADAHLDILITCTYRSSAEQERLYAQGRTAPGFKVTNARGGQSLHNKGLALDFVPMLHGKPQWDEETKFKIAAMVAQQADPTVKWGGDFRTFKDMPHLEWRLPPAGDQWAESGTPPAPTPEA